MSSIKKLYSDHYKLLNQQVFIKEDLDYTIVDNHIKNLENISVLAPQKIRQKYREKTILLWT